MQKRKTLILVPGDAYRGMGDLEAARKYMKMASDEYDDMIGFDPVYEQRKDDEDYHERVRKNPGRGLDLFVFYEQPINEVLGKGSILTSSSNLLLLGSQMDDKKEVWSPYLEAIEVEGKEEDVLNFISAVSGLYVERNCWNMHIHEHSIGTREVNCFTDRFERIHILNHDEVIGIAIEKLGFEPDRIPWG